MQKSSVEQQRKELIKKLFHDSVPQLWCPPLTHYKNNGEIDFNRMKKHINYLLPYINSFLIPGSTGDGWELSLEEYKAILEFIHKEFGETRRINLIIGLLREHSEERAEFLEYAVEFLRKKRVPVKADSKQFSYFKGFVVCPKKGKDFTQEELKQDLEQIIEQNYPIVLYQLPQVSQNEMSPEMVEALVSDYYNIYMLKDSSGNDRIANSKKDFKNLIILRGAEGDYFQHLKATGGNYYGFLLSTGNSFPQELSMLLHLVYQEHFSEAKKLSDRLTQVSNAIFEIAKSIPTGNAFTNANKLIDHFNAYGNKWREHPPPMLHSGEKIDFEVLEEAYTVLQNYNLVIKQGYMFGQ